MTIDFAVPQWFVLTLILPFLAGLKWWSRSRAAAAVDLIVARRLQAQLVKRQPWWADWTGFGLQLLALLAFITALARPQWGFHQIETTTAERNIFLAIDTSRSMLAEDVQPNRLDRAKLLAQDLVRNLPVDRIGVIAFAGKAFIQAPLTVDHDAVLETLSQLDAEVIPRGGTNLAGPALLAIESMRETETSLAALVLFSDGEDLEGEQERAQLAKQISDSKLLVISVGAGTTAGSIIPDPEAPGQFLKDESGQIVRTRLNPAALRELCEMSGGVYVDMGSEGSVTSVVQQALRKLESARLRAEDVRVPHERYAIPLAAGMLLLILSHVWPNLIGLASRPRRRAVAVLPLVAGVALFTDGGSAQAASAGDALQAYQNGSFAEAQELFSATLAKAPFSLVREHCQFGIGAAAFRGGDFETAKESFSLSLLSRDRSLQEKSHYNLANALFESGRLIAKSKREDTKAQWEAALEHYDLALALNAGNSAAKQNRKFVEDLLNKMANEPPPPEEEKPEPEPEEQKKEEEKPDQQPKENPPPDKPEPPKPEDNPPQSDEQQKPEDPKKGQEEPPAPENSPEQNPPKRPWNPSQARQILEQNAGEDLKAKPVQEAPYSSQPFKNW